MRKHAHTDLALLEHIRVRAARIEEYTKMERSRFYDSNLAEDAVIRNLQTIAESTQRLSDGLRATEPEVPWRAIAGFRNVLVHDYSQRISVHNSSGAGATRQLRPVRCRANHMRNRCRPDGPPVPIATAPAMASSPRCAAADQALLRPATRSDLAA